MAALIKRLAKTAATAKAAGFAATKTKTDKKPKLTIKSKLEATAVQGSIL
jgi:hypothetical protein